MILKKIDLTKINQKKNLTNKLKQNKLNKQFKKKIIKIKNKKTYYG
jgi:hypothetical protein